MAKKRKITKKRVKKYSLREISKVWSWAYGENFMKEYDGFVKELKKSK